MCVDPCAVAVWILPPVTYFHNKSHTTALHIEHTHTHTHIPTKKCRRRDFQIHALFLRISCHPFKCFKHNSMCNAFARHKIRQRMQFFGGIHHKRPISPSENPIVYEWNRESPFDQWLCAKNRKEIINFDLNFYGENQSKQLQLIVNMKHWKDKH